MRIIFVFLDGIGLAPATPENPVATATTPALQQLLGGPLTREQAQQGRTLLLKPIDANLGVPGLPQSGTGHTALLAGVNAPQMVGRHQPHFPPVALRPLLVAQSMFRRAQDLGRRPVFANTFTEGYWQALAQRRLRRTASVIAAEGAGLSLPTLDDFRAGRSLMWDITGEALASMSATPVPVVSSPVAGARLAALASAYDLVFFECFLPDLVGHGRTDLSATDTIARIDGMLGGLLDTVDPAVTLLVTSDHGNIEDCTTSRHTRNPVPLLVVGPAAPLFAQVADISQVADGIEATLQA